MGLGANNWLSPTQNGFRQFRSTTDHLVQLESNICNAFSNNLHVIAVAMDIEKTYEMIWKKRIITILEEKGITGRVIDYIENFLKDRSIQVRINNTLSQIIETQNGVPQGSVMRVTLFLIAINDILSPLRPLVKGLLFADDLTIFCSGKIISNSLKILQSTLNNLSSWAQKSGFKFSPTKTEYIVFSRSTLPHQQLPRLKLGNTTLRRSFAVRILGLTFNPNMSWNSHIKTLKAQCKRRIDIMKTISSKSWGADRDILLNTYKAIIQSKLDYGAILDGSAKENILRTLNPIQTTALRLAIGAFRSSPNNSVLAESGELPLEQRRIGLILSYTPPDHHLPELSPSTMSTFENRPSLPKPLLLRQKHQLELHN